MVQRRLHLTGHRRRGGQAQSLAHTLQRGPVRAREGHDDGLQCGRRAGAQQAVGGSKTLIGIVGGQAGRQQLQQRRRRRAQQALGVRLHAFAEVGKVGLGLLRRVQRGAAPAPDKGQLLSVDLQEFRDVAGAGLFHGGPRPGRGGPQLMETVPARMRCVPLARTSTSSPRSSTLPSARKSSEASPQRNTSDSVAVIVTSRCADLG